MPVKAVVILIMAAWLGGCVSLPQGVEPVGGFELNRYLGTWYEVARLDHSFERGLSRVSAEYQLREDGGVTVLNRGYDAADARWQSARGKAYFVNAPEQGYLKVSFFGPFYGAYVVFELDHQDYQYAFVAGPNRNYLWLLARTPAPPPAVIERFVASAKILGFNTDNLIFVAHSPPDGEPGN